MTTIPNLAGIATADLVEKIGTGNFSAAYINWSRTMALLREHAPGWQPELVNTADGGILHRAPVGAYLLIRFSNGDTKTPPVPQAVMDNRNASIPTEKITARDITDTHRRGVCMAAAFTFGLAYELWAKLPLESGFASQEPQQPTKTPGPVHGVKDGIGDDLPQDWKDYLTGLAVDVTDAVSRGDVPAALDLICQAQLEDDQRIYLDRQLNSKTRAAMKVKP